MFIEMFLNGRKYCYEHIDVVISDGVFTQIIAPPYNLYGPSVFINANEKSYHCSK